MSGQFGFQATDPVLLPVWAWTDARLKRLFVTEFDDIDDYGGYPDDEDCPE